MYFPSGHDPTGVGHSVCDGQHLAIIGSWRRLWWRHRFDKRIPTRASVGNRTRNGERLASLSFLLNKNISFKIHHSYEKNLKHKQVKINMQTFLPYSNFRLSAKVLDYKRLGKQRVEAKQLIDLLTNEEKRKNSKWRFHPAAKMWSENVDALKCYYNCILSEWIERKYNNTMNFYFDIPIYEDFIISHKDKMPWWLGYIPLHASHRSNLLRKDKVFYESFEWPEVDDLPYWWPYKPKNDEWTASINCKVYMTYGRTDYSKSTSQLLTKMAKKSLKQLTERVHTC